MLRTLRNTRSIPFKYLESWDIRQPFRPECTKHLKTVRATFDVFLPTMKLNNYIFVPVDFYDSRLIIYTFTSVFPVPVPEGPGANPVSYTVGIHTRCFPRG
jgi:hypothetical protein